MFPDKNPFSTSAIRPGAIPFRFAGTTTLQSLVADLARHDWRGEIRGPHGSGKSTLLHALFPELAAAGRHVSHHVVQPGNRSGLDLERERTTWSAATQVVVEGYELLSRRVQKQLDQACRQQQAGLLITCHQPQGLPTLWTTTVSLDFAQSLVRELLPPDCDWISDEDVRRGFEEHGQNLRELLFGMYDLYEQRRPRTATP